MGTKTIVARLERLIVERGGVGRTWEGCISDLEPPVGVKKTTRGNTSHNVFHAVGFRLSRAFLHFVIEIYNNNNITIHAFATLIIIIRHPIITIHDKYRPIFMFYTLSIQNYK